MWDSKRDTDVYNSLMDSVGEGEGGMIWENGIQTCIISYVKWIASPGSMHDTGCLELVHWDDPEGWYGEGGGRGFSMGNMCTPVADSCWCMAKPIQYYKEKNKIKNKRKKKELFNFSFFGIRGWDIDRLLWYWMVALKTNRDHSVIFEIAPKYCNFRLFCWLWGLFHFF